MQLLDYNIVLDGVALPLKEQLCSLRVLPVIQLHLDAQVTAVAMEASLPSFSLCWSDLATVVHALETFHLDYCNVRYMGLPQKVVGKLQLIQNMMACKVTGI